MKIILKIKKKEIIVIIHGKIDMLLIAYAI